MLRAEHLAGSDLPLPPSFRFDLPLSRTKRNRADENMTADGALLLVPRDHPAAGKPSHCSDEDPRFEGDARPSCWTRTSSTMWSQKWEPVFNVEAFKKPVVIGVTRAFPGFWIGRILKPAVHVYLTVYPVWTVMLRPMPSLAACPHELMFGRRKKRRKAPITRLSPKKFYKRRVAQVNSSSPHFSSTSSGDVKV